MSAMTTGNNSSAKKSLWTWLDCRARAVGFGSETESAHADEEPGDVCGGSWRGGDDGRFDLWRARIACRDFRLRCRSRCGCGSRCSLQILRRRWRKGAAKRRRIRCGKRAQKPLRDCCADGVDEEIPGSQAARRAIWWWLPPENLFLAMAKLSRASRRVDESAITGESAPVIRESGGDRSAL